MYKNKSIFRVLLVCICITLVIGCIGVGALASSTVKSVLQVDDIASSATLKDGNIQVALAQKDVFTYNEILDLSAASKDVQLVNMQFNPAKIGVADATRVKIRLTDLYDEDNYITISLNHFTDDWASGHIYMTAGAADQPQVGVENAGDPANMKPHVNDIYGYGAAVDYSLSGLPKSSEDTDLTLYFDYAEKALYADRETYTHSKQLVVDLDDATYFGTDLWTGFTTGQVKMSVFASNYQSATCNFTISTINGNSSFSANDQSAPIITVNTGYAQNALPVALVGKPYPIFAATAIDGCDGNVETTVTVRHRGYSVNVPVEDGKFTPTQSGVYVIEYTAKDCSGNTATESVSVNAVVGDSLQVTLRDVISETDIGAPVQVISGIDCVNASGNVSYSIVAENKTTGDQVEIDPQTRTFIPMTEGDWKVTVTARDYISTVVETFTVTANRTSQPQVYDTVPMQDYFVLGSTYQLPTLYGYDFSSGEGVLTAMDVYVTENGSSETAVANGTYTPATEGAVTVTYRLTVDGKTCERTYAATVVKVKTVLNTVDLSKYFVVFTGAATAKTASAKTTYTFSKDTTLDFVNFVQVKQLSFAFQVGSTNAYNKISVYFTDIISGKQVKLSYIKNGDGVAFSVNDGAETQLKATSFASSYSLAFSSDTGIVTPETDMQLKVKTFLDGSEFTGFTDSVARFAVELSEVTGSSQFVVQTLNGQKFNYATKDSTAPQFIGNALSGTVYQGDKLQLKGPFVYDVLDPVATVTLKVTDPDGTVVTDENGVALSGTQDASKDTAFVLEKYGTYTIFYTTKDGKNNTGRHIYTITAVDGEAPTITLLEHTEAVKPGETVTIAEAQVTDNITTDCTVVSYVFDPEGVSMPVTNGSFVAEEGVYTVRYMAFDEQGNCGFASYEIEAKTEKTPYISQSMSLGSDLILHLWGNVPADYADSISGSLTYGNEKQPFKLSQLSQTENGLYHAQAEMAVAQMTEDIKLSLKHTVFEGSVVKNYTLRDYLVAVIEGEYDEDTKQLCLELLNMGAWAQKYFDYKESHLANDGYEITPSNTITAESPAIGVAGGVDGITLYGTSLRYLSKTAVRFYFVAPEGVEGYNFTVDGTHCEPVEKDGMYYIEVSGINPQDMDDPLTVEVTDGTDTLSAQYAPIWYFIRSYNKAQDDTVKNLMAAAYSYYKTAADYEVQNTPGSVQTPAAATGEGVYICLDVLFTTLGNSTEDVEIGFFPHNFEGSINDCTEKVVVKAGTTTTVRLNAEKYMVDGVIPEGLGFAVFSGPEWDAKLSDGYTPDRHTVKITNARIEGAVHNTMDLNCAVVTSGTNGTGYTDANGNGVASVGNGAIVITDGFRYDGHKITITEKIPTYICMDMEITTLGNSTDSIDVRFYRHGFDGDAHSAYTDLITVNAGAKTAVQLPLDNYLVDGEFPGFGFAVFGGPAWDTQLADGTYDRHAVTVSNIRLEGGSEQHFDLSEATVKTGFANTNSGGIAAVVDGAVAVTGGFCYDGHMITFAGEGEPETTEPEATEPEETEPEVTEPEETEPETTVPPVVETENAICVDMLITTLSGNYETINIGFYPHNFEGDINNHTDIIEVPTGTTYTVKLELDKYLVDGEIPGIGIAVLGGPAWDAKLPDGYTPDRHSITISGIYLEGEDARTIDLNGVTLKNGQDGTGYTNANAGGTATVADGVISITGGFFTDGYKLTFGDETVPGENGTSICVDLLFTTLGGSTDPVELGFYPYNFEGDINDHTDKIAVTAGTKTTVKLDAAKYMVDGELTGIGFAIFGGPAWDAKLPDGYTPDRHTITISGIYLEGEQSTVYDLSQSVWASGQSGTGYTNANGSGAATIGSEIVITNGFQYDGHKISLVEDTNTYICMDLQLDTVSDSWADDIEIRFCNNSQEDSVHTTYADSIKVTAGTKTTVKLNVEKYLVDGELPGFSVAIFGGPEWNTQISDGVYDRHSVVISNLRLEGVGAADIDLRTATVSTGISGSNGGGQIAIVDGTIVITNGFRYDGHKIMFEDSV